MEDLGNICLKRNAASPTLKIAQFTDLHHWPAGVTTFVARGREIKFEKENYSAEKTVQLITHTLTVPENNDLDLAIFTGDIIDGRPFKNLPADSFLEAFQELIAPLNEREIPWLFLPGNHDDDESPWERGDLLKLFQLEGCLTPTASSFNFTFTLSKMTSDGESNRVRLWIFDSGGNHENKALRYHTFEKESVLGYELQSKQFQEALGEAEPRTVSREYARGLAYFHIPLPEYEGLVPVNGMNGLFDAAVLGEKIPWAFNNFLGIAFLKLFRFDRVTGCSKLNSGLFEKMKQLGNIQATFCGHE